MQEEIEQKTINLCISTTQLTARTLPVSYTHLTLPTKLEV